MSEIGEEVGWEEVFESDRVEIVAAGSTLKKLVEMTGTTVTEDGRMLDETNSPVYANDEQEISFGELGAIAAGSKIFIRDNLASFSDYLASKIARTS